MAEGGDLGGTRSVARILIAKDEPGISGLLSDEFEADGFISAVAEDGRDALAMAESQDFDLLVLDLGLPGKDGLSVLRELRAGGTPCRSSS